MPTGLGGERLWLCPTLEGENLDLSGNGNHGTYNGGMGTVADKYKGSRAFDFYSSSNQYVSVPTLDMRNLTQFSWSAWIRNTRVTGVNTILFSSSSSGGSEYLYDNFIFYRNVSTGRVGVAVDNNSDGSGDGGVFPNGVWNHAAVVFDGNGSTNSERLRYFLNGEEVSMTYNYTVPSVTPNRATTNVLIGGYAYNLNANNAMDGQQDDIRVFKRTLTPVEIKHLASKRGVLGSPHSPITLKSRITKLVSDRDDSIKPNLLSIKKTKRSEPSYKSGYAKSASESASPHLWDGLVGAWMPSLGVTGDTLRDVSGNGNHGTLTNMDASTDWVATSKGLALDFDGTGEIVSLPESFLLAGFHSFSTTIRFDAFNSVVAGGGSNTHYLLYVADANNLYYRDSNGFSLISTNANLEIGKQHHIAVTRKNNTVKAFVDGVFKGSGQRFGTAIINTIGGYPNTTASVNGQISSASIYDRTLSPQEIQELYVDSLAPFRQKSIRIFGGVGIPTDTSKIITVKRSKHVEPSYKSGYAQSAGESAHPNLWDGMASWVPALGSKGSEIPCTQDKSRGLLNAGVTFSGTTETNLLKNNYLSFDGSDDYMRIYDSSLKNVGYTNPDECLAIRFRRRSLTGTTALFGYLSAGFLGTYGRGFYFDGTTMHCMSKTSNNNAAITTTVDDNQWHVAIANFGANGSFYLDGKLIGSGNLNSSWHYWLQLASASAHVSPPGNAANAAVDVSAAYQWDRLLTASEIQTLSISPLAPFRKKQQVAFNAYPLTLLQKIRSAAKPTTPVSVRVKHNEKPSYKAGYAKSADESASPHLWDGLVGAWMPSLGVTGETLRDVSGNGHHGTLTGMDAATDWVATSKGLALDMFSPNDSIDAGSMDDFSDELTINIVEKTNANTDGIRISLGSTTACNFGFQNNSNLNLRLFCRPSGQNYVVVNSGAIRSINSFATYSLTFNRGSVKFWKNGKVFSTHSFGLSSLPASTNELTIGAFAGYVSGGAYVRQFTSLQLYNRALSPQEIQELYVDSLAPFRRKAKPIGYQPNKELIGLFKV